MPEEKRPTDNLIWYGTPEKLKDWFDKVFKKKKVTPENFEFEINEDDIG